MDDLFEAILSSRNHFFRRNVLQFHQRRDDIVASFLENERLYLQTLQTLIGTPVVSQTFQFPLESIANLLNPVIVAPSPSQLLHELVSHPHAEGDPNCAICQDSASEDGVHLRGCGHVYHRSCIRTWFQTSVRCPVCRRDIREDHPNQTSSGAIPTQSQSASPSEGE